MDPTKQTHIDFSSSTYRDRGGEVYQLTSCVRAGDSAYVAGPAHGQEQVAAFQRWLLPEPGWMVGCFLLHPNVTSVPWHWYIDLATTQIESDQWLVNDHYIDVIVFDEQRYEVLDLDEFADALEAGSLSHEEGIATLRSTHRLCAELEELDFSVPALLERHAPALPAFQSWETVTIPQ